MKEATPPKPRSSAVDWIFAFAAVIPFFAYILAIAYAPHALTRPVAPQTLVSAGIAGGVSLTVYLIAIAGLYTWLRNRSDSR